MTNTNTQGETVAKAVDDVKLLPCPFCGGLPRIDLAKKTHCQLHGEPMQSVAVYCYHDCKASPRVEAGDVFNGGEALARTKAIAAWNTRATSPEIEQGATDAVVKPLERFEPFADQDDGEFKGMGAVPDGERVRYADILSCFSPAAVVVSDAAGRPTYDQIIALVEDCRVRRDKAGESSRMMSKWISEGLNALLAASSISPTVTAKDGEGETAAMWRENVEAMLSNGDPDVIRCHEGGGPESLIGSLVLTMMRTRKSRDKALAAQEPNHDH